MDPGLQEVGADTEVLLDTGIMSGADIVAAIALGARFTLIGRAYLYGLMAGGREGVDRTIEILSEQVARTMRLLGVATLDELTPAHSPNSPDSVPSHRQHWLQPPTGTGCGADIGAHNQRAETHPTQVMHPVTARPDTPI